MCPMERLSTLLLSLSLLSCSLHGSVLQDAPSSFLSSLSSSESTNSLFRLRDFMKDLHSKRATSFNNNNNNNGNSPPQPISKRMTGLAGGGNSGVDAWSICPPHMQDVDCFYAYLRVYARLRKAAEESDRVSMRNIGKRSTPRVMSLSGNGRSKVAEKSDQVSMRNIRKRSTPRVTSISGESRGDMGSLLQLCPEEMSHMECYQALRTLYGRLQALLLRED